MGATFTEQRAEAKTAKQAYEIAVDNARAYYGHQDGYSGAINSKDSGFVFVSLPPRMTYAKFLDLLSEVEFSPDEQIRDLNDSIKWREAALARPATDPTRIKRADRPAVRKLIAQDKASLRKAQTAKKKFDAKIASCGIDRDRLEAYERSYSDKWGAPLCVELSPREAKPSRRGYRVYVFFGYAPC